MKKYTLSADQSKIAYTESGQGETALIFVHGWLGNGNWWNKQEEYFKEKYTIVKVDLRSHGDSSNTQTDWNADQYAADIIAVINEIKAPNVILIGHSMSGAYVLQASLNQPKVKRIIMVDTLKDLSQDFTPEMAEEYMYQYYRHDFNSAVKDLMPQYLFTSETPTAIIEQLQNEFMANEGDFAIKALKPLYEMDLRSLAQHVNVPVVGINSDYTPSSEQNNQSYFKNFKQIIIQGTGHYPMMEKPAEFNRLLDESLNEN